MHPFSILTLGIFVAGYITARWDLVTRLYELAIFAWNYGVVVSNPPPRCGVFGAASNPKAIPSDASPYLAQARAAKGFAGLSLVFFFIFLPVERLATREANLVRTTMHFYALPTGSTLC
jgi:phosphatidylinositol glycan class Q protein